MVELVESWGAVSGAKVRDQHPEKRHGDDPSSCFYAG